MNFKIGNTPTLVHYRLPDGAVRLLAKSSWPGLVGVGFLVLSLVLLGFSWHYRQKTTQLTSQRAGAAAFSEVPTHQFARASTPSILIPDEGQYLDDLSRLFKLAKAQGIQIDSVNYRNEKPNKLGLALRQIEIHTQDDYPRLKGFMADLLSQMPHAALNELRIDRKDIQSIRGQMLVTITFVYRASTVLER